MFFFLVYFTNDKNGKEASKIKTEGKIQQDALGNVTRARSRTVDYMKYENE